MDWTQNNNILKTLAKKFVRCCLVTNKWPLACFWRWQLLAKIGFGTRSSSTLNQEKIAKIAFWAWKNLNFYVKLNWKWNLELEFKNFEGKLQKSWIILLFFAFEFCSTIQQHWYKLRRLSHYQSKRKLRNGNHATSFRYFTHFEDSVSQINRISLIFR